jgi:uncharacterized membrane protein
VRPEPLWLIDFRQRIAASLWFVPTIFAVAAIVLADLSVWLDAEVDAPIGVRADLVADPSTAATFSGAIAAATLAFVAVVFATTLVAIQLAASQYSPRAVRIFIRSRVTRVTLGLFLATFVFSLVLLVSNRASDSSAKQYAPVVSVTALLALSLGTVFGFVVYLHRVVGLMRVQYLLEKIAAETRRAIDENFPPSSAYVEAEPPRLDPAPRRVCHAGKAGVLTATDLYGLVELGRQRQCWLELTVEVGEYLAHGTPVALVHGGDLRDREITRLFLIRGERTFVQDPAFGFRQLVDTAIRALSPAVNDPTTAVQAIDRISDLLGIAGMRLDPTGVRVDSAGTVRLKRKLRDFDGLLVLALTEVIHYGANTPQVVRRLRAMLDELQAILPEERYAAIGRQRSLLDAAVSAALPAPFESVSSTADRQGLG